MRYYNESLISQDGILDNGCHMTSAPKIKLLYIFYFLILIKFLYINFFSFFLI